MPYHFTTPHKPAQTRPKHKEAETENLIDSYILKQIFSLRLKKTIHHLRHNDKNKLVQEDPLNFSPLNEEINGEECTGWGLYLLTLREEWISEGVVGIVVFASVSPRSLDKDPSWTPCGRSSYGIC